MSRTIKIHCLKDLLLLDIQTHLQSSLVWASLKCYRNYEAQADPGQCVTLAFLRKEYKQQSSTAENCVCTKYHLADMKDDCNCYIFTV